MLNPRTPYWEKEIEKEKKEIMAISKANPCASCIHDEICGNKDNFLSIIEEVNNKTVSYQGGGIKLNDIPWIRVGLNCVYFRSKVGVR